jgi:hypothetical protein
VGDIIVYQKEDQLIIHRVVSMDGTTLVTQGDANNVADEPIDISSVKGKMVSRIPVLGGLIRDLKTPIAAVAAKFITGDSGSDTAQCAAWVVQTQTDSEDTDLLINIYDKNNTDVHKAVYEFSIRNYNENHICEVSMTYQIDVVLPEAWEGITMKLTKNGSNKVLTGQTKDDQTFTFCSDDLSFVAGTAATDQLKLEISLAKGTKNEKAEKILDGILVNVTTVQSEE